MSQDLSRYRVGQSCVRLRVGPPAQEDEVPESQSCVSDFWLWWVAKKAAKVEEKENEEEAAGRTFFLSENVMLLSVLEFPGLRSSQPSVMALTAPSDFARRAAET